MFCKNQLTLDHQTVRSLVGVAHLSLVEVLGKDSLNLSLDRRLQGLSLGQNPSVLVGATVAQVLAVIDDRVVHVVGGNDVVVDRLVRAVVPGDGHAAFVGGSSQDGVSVVVQLGVVSVAPPDSNSQFRGFGDRKVVRVVEGRAVSVHLQRCLVALQLIPVAGILRIRIGEEKCSY